MEWYRSMVRPTVTLIFAIGVTVGFYTRVIPQDVYTPFAFTVIGYWFGTRGGSKES